MSAFGRRRFPITLIVVGLFGGVVVLLLGLVVALSYQSHLRSTLQFIAERVTQTSAFVVDELRDHLDPVMQQGDWTAGLIAQNSFDDNDEERLGDTLLAALAATPQVTGLVFIHADGRPLVALRDAGGRLDPGASVDADFVARTLSMAQQSRSGFWNEILYSEASQRSYLNHVTPVWRGKRFAGAVLAGVSLNELSEMVGDIKNDLRSTFFILAGRDRVIAHPNLTSPHPDLSQQQPTVALDRIGDPVLAEFRSAEVFPIAQDLELKDITIRQAKVGERNFLFSSTEVSGYGADPWIVGAYADAETAGAELRALRHSALAGLALLLLGGALAMFIGRTVARPIKTASVGIARIADLEVSEVEPLPPSRFSELDAQARAFNAMLGALRWFETYVPRSLVRRLIHRGEAEIASESREISVLFTDLVGFTETSEAMTASETAALLNHHFALLGSCVESEAGTIDKFMGDALMAFWGAPDDQADHAARAVRATVAMARAVRDDNQARRASGLRPVRMRLGLHSGPAVVGNIGAPERMNYTVVGDTVNTAQRMESLGKDVAPDAEIVILASQALVLAAGPEVEESCEFEDVGAFVVKGRSEPIRVFRVAY